MMRIVFFVAIAPILAAGPALAQGWRWAEEGPVYRDRREGPTYDRPPRYSRTYDDDRPYYRHLPAPRPYSSYEPSPRRDFEGDRLPRITDGGPRPEIDPISPQRVAYRSRYSPGTIIIDTAGRQLLLLQNDGIALRYPISVGRDGFAWTGEEKISRVAEWPDWHPPAEMRERDPRLPEKMTGGLRNPLGAKALYLGNTLYRIHGTNDARSIGRASSSGCFRMLNGHVIDLAERVGVGTRVVVTSNLRAAETASGKRG